MEYPVEICAVDDGACGAGPSHVHVGGEVQVSRGVRVLESPVLECSSDSKRISAGWYVNDVCAAARAARINGGVRVRRLDRFAQRAVAVGVEFVGGGVGGDGRAVGLSRKDQEKRQERGNSQRRLNDPSCQAKRRVICWRNLIPSGSPLTPKGLPWSCL